MGVVVVTALAPIGVRAQVSAPTGSPGAADDSQARPSRVHVAFHSAIDSYRRGDYELAAIYFQQAQAGQEDLTPAERKEMTNWLQLNSTALQARREGANLLRQAEQAYRQGRAQDALKLVNQVSRNQQFLAGADKQRLQVLSEQMQPLNAGSMVKAASGDAAILTQARTKLKQARLLLSRGDLVPAQALAMEADRLGATYAPGEDTPQRLLADIKARQAVAQTTDPNRLLEAARAALKRGDLDEAQRLAMEADKYRSFWSSMQIWSDSPSKVLKDIQAARVRLAAQKSSSSLSGSDATVKVDTYKPSADGATSTTPDHSQSPGDNTAIARQLLKEAHKALDAGDLVRAKQLTERARGLKPQLNWWEDTPDKLLAEIRRVEGSKPTTKSKDSVAVDNNPPDPRVLLKQARELYEAGKLEEAEKLAMRAGAVKSVTWGLFEGSPDKLLTDIHKARIKRDQEESVRVLEEARKQYAQGNLKEAESLAHRAERLHGPYSIWDLSDRPQKLIAEIDVTKAKSREGKLPPLPADLAKKNADNPANSTGFAAAPKTSVTPLPVWPNNAQSKTGDTPVATASATLPIMPPTVPSMANGSKEQARLLLLEARQCQKEGRLLEARQKALEAQRVGAAFGSNEDTPELALLAISALCQKRIDALVQQATDYATALDRDPSRCQRAEANLMQARQLAMACGFDTQAVDMKLSWVHQMQQKNSSGSTFAQAPALPSLPQLTAAPGMESGQQHGQKLLNDARMELHAGQTSNARRLAEEAFSPQYGVQNEATQLLRSIDAEEYNQKILAADHAFDAGQGAFQRREYSQAGTMFRTIDPHLLSTDKQARLKEYMLTPELQPSAIAQVGMKSTNWETDSAHTRNQSNDPVGTRTATDADFAQQVKAMQEVRFQKLREDGLQAQSEANRLFLAGQTDRALEILGDFRANLSDGGIDSEHVAILRRQVDARIAQYRTLKAQRDLESMQANAAHAGDLSRSKLAQQEEEKKKEISKLMAEFKTDFKEAKYEQAEVVAMRAKELDPDDPGIGAAVYTARMQRNLTQYNTNKQAREDRLVDQLNEAENPGPPVNSEHPLLFDPKITKLASSRKAYDFTSLNKPKSERESEIIHKLDMPITPMDFKDTPLRTILDDLGGWTGINIVPDEPALVEQGISLDKPMTMKLENIALKSALNLLLHQAHLTYVVKDEVLNVTTEEHARGKLVNQIHPVLDLVIPVDDSTPFVSPLKTMMAEGITPGSNVKFNAATPFQGMNSLPGGQTVSQNQTMNSTAGLPTSNAAPVWNKQNAKGTIEEVLMRLIQNTIQPQSWASLGGQGTIDFYPLGMALVINQTPDIQEQVAELLQALRRLQDQEVSVEVRFITLAESFYERIGVDFNINIRNNQNRYASQLVSQQFQPFGFINSFSPSNFVTGLTQAGATGNSSSPGLAFTQDLGIPINNSSFNMAVPPFGAYPNIPGANGGISLGLAFLSDIEVYMFMEAAQGDQRTNVMQAPKLTLFNGQVSTLAVTDQQFFVTSVAAVQVGGQVVFIPNNTPLPTAGVNITINAVISADRRFVRMSLPLDLTNIASANVQLFPITTFITPILEGGAVGQPVPFTQFLQQPAFSNINVNTTVNVPDGGTVVLGGLKRLSEGRNEFGPPILSKIPYLDRLFKNVGYGRETESLMIMVTPRIIINEEEELRQVPGLAAAQGGQ